MEAWIKALILITLFCLAMLVQVSSSAASTGTWIGAMTAGAGMGRIGFLWLTTLLGVAVFSVRFRK